MQVDEQQFSQAFDQGLQEGLAILEKQAAPIDMSAGADGVFKTIKSLAKSGPSALKNTASSSNLPATAKDYVQWAKPGKKSLLDSFKNISPETKMKGMQLGAGAALAGGGYAAGHARMKSKAENAGVIDRMRGNFS